MTIRTFLVALLIVPSCLAAQQVRFDPTSGDYFITVYNDQHEASEARLIPANKVMADVSVEILGGGPGRTYQYLVSLPSGGPQGLEVFMLSCLNDPAMFQSLSGTPVPPNAGGAWATYQGDNPAGAVCEFSGSAVVLSHQSAAPTW